MIAPTITYSLRNPVYLFVASLNAISYLQKGFLSFFAILSVYMSVCLLKTVSTDPAGFKSYACKKQV